MALVLVLFGAWQALKVRSSLQLVASHVGSAARALREGRTEDASWAISQASDAANAARQHSRGPIWSAAAHLPWVGDDVGAVRLVAEIADELLEGPVPDLVQVTGRIGSETLKPEEGRFETEPLARAAPTVDEAAAAVGQASRRLQGVNTAGLSTGLAGPVADLQSRLEEATSAADAAAIAARVLPPMMGLEERRNYLLVVQGSSDIRALGGAPYGMAVLSADDGRLRLYRHDVTAELAGSDPRRMGMTRDEVALLTTRATYDPDDMLSIPDFPRSAELLAAMWRERYGSSLDGVVSIDPVAMAYLLQATGPVTLPVGSKLSADNAEELLHPKGGAGGPVGGKELLRQAAKATLTGLLSGDASPRALLTQLDLAAGDRRLMVWSAHEAEQDRIAGTAIAGALPPGDSSHPEIGVYLDDVGANEPSDYLDYRVTVTPRSCEGGRQTMEVLVELTSTVPPGPEAVPAAVAGPPRQGGEPRTMEDSVRVYTPAGGYVESVTLDQRPIDVTTSSHRGREVASTTVLLSPGQSRRLAFEVVSADRQPGDPHLTTTPPSRDEIITEVRPSAC